jgi:ferritin-like metal-binding protein YciE
MAERQTAVSRIFITGLKNAHAMEKQALSLLRQQIDRIENYPQVAERLEMHLRETEGQIDRLEMILDDLGESPSRLKDAGLGFLGNVAALGHMFARDEILKNHFANFAFENYEIAAYKALCRLAELGGGADAVGRLRENLLEEEAMARWLDDHVEHVTTTFFTRSQEGAGAEPRRAAR